MAKYEKPGGLKMTLNSTTLIAGVVVVLLLMLAGFGMGTYTGYQWGYQAGTQVTKRTTDEASDPVAQFLEEQEMGDTATGTSSMSSDTWGDGSFSDEDLGFLDDETSNRSTDSPGAPGRGTGTGTNEPGSGESLDRETTEPGGSGRERDPARIQPQSGTVYTIQTVSTQKKNNAESFAQRLNKKGFDAVISTAVIDGVTWYRVRVGAFNTRTSASEQAERMVDQQLVEDYWISKVQR